MRGHNIIEDELEQAALEWFEELNYEIAFAPDLSPGGEYPERSDYSEVIFEERLMDALRRMNPGRPQEALNDALHQILVPLNPALIDNNRLFQKMITDGVNATFRANDGRMVSKQVRIFDFDNVDNNDFLVVNQFTVMENRVEKRPDVVVFVNGIPLVVIELKNLASEEVEISDAFNQIQNYIATIPSLFTYNSFSVISDGVNARVGTLTADEDRFMIWRTIEGREVAPPSRPQLEVLIKGMFAKERLLDIIKSFVLFQTDGENTYKILAGYHQFHAVNKAVESTKRAAITEGDRKAGVVWHTQGSGKSLSMVFYVGKLVLARELNNPTIVVITDRNDLDDQLFATFARSKDLLRQEPVQAQDRADLRRLLTRESGGIIFTTIHKFAPEEKGDSVPVLTDRENVIVIADEAHRSQYGFGADVIKGETEADIKYGYAKYMRDALPKASYIGFTGTPISLTDKNTRAVFGEYIDIYDMTRAVEDGTTVRIFYESRIAKLELPDQLKPVIDNEYEEITEYQEYTQKEKLKSKWSRLEAIVGAEQRVKAIAKDIVEHFEKRLAAQETDVGKGMMVAMSRRIAADLYKAVVELRPEWHSNDVEKGVIKVVMTGSSSDPKEWLPFVGTKATRDRIAKRMKDNKDELKLVIVRDMWLTGFDVPSMHTMYIDKPMQGHNLMQAIARVNRVFKEKQGGLIVDYIGIAENLKNALSDYTESDREKTGVDTEMAAAALLERYELIKELLHGHAYQKFFTGSASDRMAAIVATIDYIIGQREERKNEYLKLVSELSKAYSLCATTDLAERLNIEVGFHKAVKSGIIKLIPENSKKKTAAEIEAQLNQLISKSIASNEVIDVLDAVGLNKPNIAILSDEFLEEVRSMKQRNLAVELLNRLLTGKIRAFAKRNLTQSKKFSELLENAIKKYQNRTIETTQVIMELIELAKEINEAHKRGENTGLTEDELAFYDALAENESAREVMGDDILKQIARDLTQAIRKNLSIDWTMRASVQAKMKMVIKRLLKQYGYPPDKTPKAVEIVMEQTRLMCVNESVAYGSNRLRSNLKAAEEWEDD